MFRPVLKRETVNLDEMCRLCLIETNNLIGIFNNDESCSLSLRIMACSALEVDQSDALPKSICVECRQLLERFYYFRKQSKISDTKLRRHIRLINSRKVSKVFNKSDDEDEEDDGFESRRFFERWDLEKQAADATALELRQQSDAESLRKAIVEERVKFRSKEAVRITNELREQLEPGIRSQVEQELRETLEPLMRAQIERQIELTVKQKQVEEIRREVQEALKGQKEELLSEYRKIHESTVAPRANNKVINVIEPKPSSSETIVEEDEVEIMDESELLEPQQPLEEHSDEQQIAEDSTFQDYEMLYDETEQHQEAGGSSSRSRVPLESKHQSAAPDSNSVYAISNQGEEDDDEEDEEDEEGNMKYEYEVDESFSEDVDAEVYAADANDPIQIDNSSLDGVAHSHQEDIFVISNNAGTEYLEEVDDNNASNVVQDPDADQEEDEDDNETTHDVITETLRKTIENYTGFQMEADFKYKIKKTPDSNISKLEVTTDYGQVLVVEFLNETQQILASDDGELKIFHCEKCPEAFSRRIQLTRHMSVHDKRRGHKCGYCEKFFPSNSSLSRHVRTHTGEKPFKCNVCNRSFIQKEILRRHENIHTGERPFACTHCDKTFTQRKVMQQHINRHHTESPIIDLHKCPKCPKSFFHASGLSRHFMVHSGRKFNCVHCEKPFSDKSALKRHVTALHLKKENEMKKEEY